MVFLCLKFVNSESDLIDHMEIILELVLFFWVIFLFFVSIVYKQNLIGLLYNHFGVSFILCYFLVYIKVIKKYCGTTWWMVYLP
jgi:hypothetical protein